jgi:hypothetical protein
MAHLGRDLILYPFSRSKVERCDFSHFLSLDAMPPVPAAAARNTKNAVVGVEASASVNE